MSAYKLYWVMSAKFKPGKDEEAAKWWREKGAPELLSEPWTKSLHAYATQFGLGGEYDLEVWQEIENYAAFDQMDERFAKDPAWAKQWEDVVKGSLDYIKWGPARLMGDWPESDLRPE